MREENPKLNNQRRGAMFVRSSELFEGISKPAMDEIEKIMVDEAYEEDAFVYRKGESAGYFYILEKGHVTLSYGAEACIRYTLNQPGDSFGLSSLVKRAEYDGSAKCEDESKIKKIEITRLYKLLERNPRDGQIFFNRLGGIIFQRIIDSYNSLLSAYKGEIPPSYG